MQTAAYAGAQWLELQSYEVVDQAGTPIDFWTFYDATTRAISFEDTRRHSDPAAGFGHALDGLIPDWNDSSACPSHSARE